LYGGVGSYGGGFHGLSGFRTISGENRPQIDVEVKRKHFIVQFSTKIAPNLNQQNENNRNSPIRASDIQKPIIALMTDRKAEE
jgi:hypothetical protein